LFKHSFDLPAVFDRSTINFTSSRGWEGDDNSTLGVKEMSNQTGGDFTGGLPTDEKKLLDQHLKESRRTGSDTSHLSNARAVQQASSPATQIRYGWHPNLNNPKG
jgi:hypothetical protein